eukprot:8982-Prymnesium_polylepis.1
MADDHQEAWRQYYAQQQMGALYYAQIGGTHATVEQAARQGDRATAQQGQQQAWRQYYAQQAAQQAQLRAVPRQAPQQAPQQTSQQAMLNQAMQRARRLMADV